MSPSHFEVASSRNLQGQFVFLGTGTSVGVPVVGCGCDVCQSDNAKNKRTRTSMVFGLPGGTLLVDTTPDLRTQLLREHIGSIDAIVYTHDHVDHVYGLDDIRPLCFRKGGPLPVYCEPRVERRIRRAFDYAFEEPVVAGGGLPKMTLHKIGLDSFDLLGATVVPLRLHHGAFEVLGFRIGNVAYCTDTNEIPDQTWPLLEGLDVLVLDCLRPSHHPTHFSIDEAVEVAQRIAPRQTYFTHMSHEIDHGLVSSLLPPGIELAYDGLTMPLS